VESDLRYTFPATSKESFYLLTLSGGCVGCDASPGVTIELIDKSNVLWDEYKRGEFIDGKLKFEKWPDSKGVAIITGFRKHEFVKALTSHLTGTSWDGLTDRDGKVDEIGAEVVLEEMYLDSLVKPHFPTKQDT